MGRPDAGGGDTILGRFALLFSVLGAVGVNVLAEGFGLNSIALALNRMDDADVGLSTLVSACATGATDRGIITVVEPAAALPPRTGNGFL